MFHEKVETDLKKKKKVDVGEYLENLKEYLVFHETFQDQITSFDPSKGCTIEEAQIAYKIVCKTGAQKMKASIEFGLYLNYLFEKIWKPDEEKCN